MAEEGSDGLHPEVAELRRRFLADYEGDISSGGVFDHRDVERVKEEDTYLDRWLRHSVKFTFKDALNALVDCLKWRKEYGVNDISADDFDEEIWSTGALYPRMEDKEGRRILRFNVRLYEKNAEKLPTIKKFLVYWFETMDRQNPTERICVIHDMTLTGFKNMDMDLIKFMINCFKFYFPSFLGVMLVYEMPWILNAMWKIIKQLLSEEAQRRIKFVSKKDIHNLVGPESLPLHMGGTDTYQWTYSPPVKEAEAGDTEQAKTEQDDMELTSSDEALVFSSHNGRAGSPLPSSPPSTSSLRQVRFNEKNSGPPLSPLEASSNQSPYANQEVIRKATVVRQRTSSTSSLHTWHQGPLLATSPSEELLLPRTARTPCVIQLRNLTDGHVIFKIKTTAIEKFRVRPGLGHIPPRGSVEITVSLNENALGSDLKREKFLILSSPSAEPIKVPSKLQEFWRAGQANACEHKLKCSLQPEPAAESKEVQLLAQVARLNVKLDQVLAGNRQMAKTMSRVYTILLLLFLLLLMAGCTAPWWWPAPVIHLPPPPPPQPELKPSDTCPNWW